MVGDMRVLAVLLLVGDIINGYMNMNESIGDDHGKGDRIISYGSEILTDYQQ